LFLISARSISPLTRVPDSAALFFNRSKRRCNRRSHDAESYLTYITHQAPDHRDDVCKLQARRVNNVFCDFGAAPCLRFDVAA